jgi:uncharacterized membrane protein YtjA (UPF0391 family)
MWGIFMVRDPIFLEGMDMLIWPVGLFMVAIIAATFGFAKLAAWVGGIALVLSLLFVSSIVVSLVASLSSAGGTRSR